MNGPDFQGWEEYPKSLPTACEDQFAYDFESYEERLTSDSKRLFVPEDEDTYIQVTENTTIPRIVNGLAELEQDLLNSRFFQGFRIIQIPQQSSVGHLAISESALRKLLFFYTVFPAFLDVIHAFGRRFEEDEDTSGSFQDRYDKIRKTYESCWLIKHAEKHGRPEQGEPWSIRQMGVYFRHDESSNRNVLIVLNPSRRFQRRLLNASRTSNPSAEGLHCLLSTATTRNWRQYLDYLQDRLDLTSRKIKVSAAKEHTRFADMLEVQNIRSKVCMATNALGMDSDAILCIEEKLFSRLSLEQRGANDKFNPVLSQCHAEFQTQLQRASNIMRRLDGAATLIQSILTFQSDAALQLTSRKAVEAAEKSRRDSRTLKTITILTLLYLPASFVSTFLGMEYVKVEDLASMKLDIKPGLGLFLILTIFFLVITLGSWGYSEWRHRVKSQSQHRQGFGYSP